MSKFKITKFTFISIFFLTLQLGACAEEVPTAVIQETATEQAAPIVKESTEQIMQTNVQVKEDIVSNSELAISAVEAKPEIVEPETIQPQIEQEVKPDVRTQPVEKTAAQEMLNLEQYKGKVVYLDFWASWCVPCQQTFPWMDAMQKKYPDDIVFVAVNFGESPEDTQEFLKRFPADIKFVYDPLVQIGSEYDIPGLPYSFIYGRSGELLGKHAGFAGGSAVNLEAALNKLFESGQ